ncbi:MAG: TRAP transporter TatT component family protein [Gammaproteobacteria bacterium]|jgi:predicted anti-sigma-YlaC factor YlaD
MHHTFAIVALSLLLSGCSIQRYAINSIGDMLASSGSVFESDDDPELIAEALPFSLKLLDSLLAEQPDHRGMLLAAARGYLLYGYAFVGTAAEQSQLEDIARTRELRSRARNLYLRAHRYASHALDLDFPGLAADLAADPEAAVSSRVDRGTSDVSTLYWTAAALGLAISASRNEPALLARLPEVEALVGRAIEIDEAWSGGSLHEFAIILAGIEGSSFDAASVDEHYRRALELAAGRSASVYVTYAESVAIPRQDRDLFTELLRRALAVDVDSDPEHRLLNVVTQQRARWLLENIDEFIL